MFGRERSDEMTVTGIRGRINSRRLLLLCGAGCLVLGFLPAALVPIQQDDLVFTVLDNAWSTTAPSPVGAVEAEIRAAIGQGRTNVGSAVAVGLARYASWQVPSLLHISVSSFEPWLSLLWLLAGVLAASQFASVAWAPIADRFISARIRFPLAFFVVAATFAIVIQIHSRWSNDPVVSYGERGFGSAVIGFLYLSVLFAAMRLPLSMKRQTAVLAAGLMTVFWYEMLWALPVIATGVLFSAGLSAGRDGSPRRHLFRIWTLGAAVPVATLAAASLLVRASGPAANYQGTQIELGAAGVKATMLGFAGTLPGAAWPLSIHQAGFAPDLRSLATVTGMVVLIAIAIGVIAGMWQTSTPASSVLSRAREPVWWLPVLAVGLFWLSSVGIIAFSEKYIAENRTLGTVYAFYVPATLALATIAYASMLLFWGRRLRRPVIVAAAAAAVVFVMIQSGINWRLYDLQVVDMASTTRIWKLVADQDASERERCSAGREFRDATFPFYAYPADQMLRGLDVLVERSTGAPWCSRD